MHAITRKMTVILTYWYWSSAKTRLGVGRSDDVYDNGTVSSSPTINKMRQEVEQGFMFSLENETTDTTVLQDKKQCSNVVI